MATVLPILPEELTAFIRKNHKTMNVSQLATTINVSEPTIYKYGAMAGVRVWATLVEHNHKDHELKKRILWIERYGENLTAAQIAKALNIPVHNIYWTVARYNLTIKQAERIPGKANAARPSRSKYFNVHARENWLI